MRHNEGGRGRERDDFEKSGRAQFGRAQLGLELAQPHLTISKRNSRLVTFAVGWPQRTRAEPVAMPPGSPAKGRNTCHTWPGSGRGLRGPTPAPPRTPPPAAEIPRGARRAPGGKTGTTPVLSGGGAGPRHNATDASVVRGAPPQKFLGDVVTDDPCDQVRGIVVAGARLAVRPLRCGKGALDDCGHMAFKASPRTGTRCWRWERCG